MAEGRRVGDAEYAERVNAAADLVEAGVPAAEAARVLAGREESRCGSPEDRRARS